MRYKIVSINNISRLQEAGDALIRRGVGFPGMGLIWGRTGYGKTTAATWMVNQVKGVYVRAWELWTPVSMLQAIAYELSLEVKGTCAQMAQAIVERLTVTRRPLFIDEADYLLSKNRLINTLRDLHDLSSVPVILIGMDGIQRRLGDNPQLTGRMAQWVEFGPADMHDARQLADKMCEIEVDDALLARMHTDSEGEVRRIVVGLQNIELEARRQGRDRLTLAEWPDKDFFLGNAPPPRAGKTRISVVGRDARRSRAG